jgi:lysozyme family protein
MNYTAQNIGYIEKKTQEQRILDLLRERGSSGVMAWEIPANLHILQYNARVYGLRKKGYDIRNKDGKFYLIEQGQIGLGLAF